METKKQKVAQIKTLLSSLQCPLLSPLAHAVPVSEEAERFAACCGSELLHLLLPTEQRLLVLEWLLHKYDPKILESNRLLSPAFTLADSTIPRRQIDDVEIETALREIGLATSATSMIDSISGKRGIEDALNLLHSLCEFVMTASVVGADLDQTTLEAVRALREVASNQVSSNSHNIGNPAVGQGATVPTRHPRRQG